MSDKVTPEEEAPAAAEMTRGPGGYKGKFMCCGDDLALENQPGCFEMGMPFHAGTKSYKGFDGMLDAGKVSGVWQDPDCK